MKSSIVCFVLFSITFESFEIDNHFTMHGKIKGKASQHLITNRIHCILHSKIEHTHTKAYSNRIELKSYLIWIQMSPFVDIKAFIKDIKMTSVYVIESFRFYLCCLCEYKVINYFHKNSITLSSPSNVCWNQENRMYRKLPWIMCRHYPIRTKSPSF